ncbi:MAG: energy transducer TonB [Novosphingobium sp.]|uniref:energy transducer TonB n=1 Tax=Novosphingobium sp. TaxID=1874826 RepID=UPI0030173B30
MRRVVMAALAGAAVIMPGCAFAAEDAAPAAAPSLQEQFSAASKAAAEGHCDTAIPLFEALEADKRVKPGSLPAAAISVRHGICLLAGDEALRGEAMIAAGLPTLEAAGPGFADEVADSSLRLGLLAFSRLDHDAAVRWLKAAARSDDLRLRQSARMRLAQTLQFDGDGAALTVLDAALAEVPEKSADKTAEKGDKQTRANFLAVRARVLMNLGRIKEAEADLKRAVDLSGGLTLTVSLTDVALRSDMAQVMLLAKRRDEARRYLAYTGAGRIEDSPFNRASYMGVPGCTGEPGLRPEDSAVVEFTIGSDGRVVAAQTVYSQGDYNAASAFARAVQDWFWEPSLIADVPGFYRNLVRVELHCSTVSGDAPGLFSPLWGRLITWAQPLAGAGEAEVSGADVRMETDSPLAASANAEAMAAQSARFKAQAAAKLAAGDSRAAGAATVLAVALARTDNATRHAEVDRAATLVAGSDPAKLDPATRAALAAIKVWAAMFTANEAARIPAGRSSISTETVQKRREAVLLPALKDPVIAADPLARNTLRVHLARKGPGGAQATNEMALLGAVVTDSELDDSNPVRQVALLRLANIAAKQKRFADAQALFARTGLSEQQCALLGDIPRLKSDGVSGASYPNAALEMGFEGWTQVEYDIAADGRTANQRSLIAYPPFVFGDAARDIISRARYDPSFRPSGSVACTGSSNTVRFIIPQ